MSKSQNVLVTGGAGYIGSHCVRQLIQAGHRPVVLDNLVFGHREAIPEGVPFYETHIAHKEQVKQILRQEQIEVVMHFAAFAYVGESVENPLKYYRNNLGASIMLLESMIEENVRKIVFSSTCATYGEPPSLPIRENFLQIPVNPYGESKRSVEKILRDLATIHEISFAAFRYFNAAGAAEDGSIGEDHKPETHLIPLAIQAAQGLRPELKIFGTDYPTPDGTGLRDYVHVDDLSRAHIAVFPYLEELGKAYYFNLGTGIPYSVREVIDTVEKVTGLKVPHTEAPRRAGDPPALYADPTLVQKVLGWEPKFNTLESIIETAWKWHQAHPNGY